MVHLGMTRRVSTAVALMVVAGGIARAQSLADLARQTESHRKTIPSPSPAITLGSDAFQDVRLTDELFSQYAATKEAVARMLLGDPTRAERLALRRRGYRPGTDASLLYSGEPDLLKAIAAMGLTPQLLEDIALSIERAFDDKVPDPTPLRLANRAWVYRNGERITKLDQNLQYIRAGLRPSPLL